MTFDSQASAGSEPIVKVRTDAYSSNIEFASYVRINEIPNGEYEGKPLSNLPDGVPWFVPTSQAYYWTKEWQQSERESMADYEAGNYVEFSGQDPDEIIRWLDADD